MLSIVVPIYNEEESLEAFYHELIKELHALDNSYEILFIDDGSIDKSLDILKEFVKKDKNCKVYSLRKNHGKSEALTLGFQSAKGETVVTLDADLQDKPSEIKKLLAKQKTARVDIVSGWRRDRKDASKMVIISHVFNAIAGRLFDIQLHDYNCGLKVYTYDAAKSLRLYGGLHRFIPLLASQQGFTVDEVIVEHEKRKFGKSKFGFSKVWKDLPDIFTILFLTRYTKRPLHFFGPIGGLLTLLGVGILTYLTILRFAGQTIGGRPLLIFGVLLLLAGLQIFFTGFLAELITNLTQKDTPHFQLKYTSENKT